ncbi:MAG: Peptidoglycan-binding protein [uncultured bacterium]|nr:MAG: Peptidoglycan-binding protein [uncultured bacterium]
MPLKIGDHSRALPEIRDRLITLGDLSQSEKSSSLLFDSALSRAVAQFQWRHGLESNGVVNQKTLNEFNVNPAVRYRELAHSMNEWAKLPEDESAHYIHVNVPSFQLRLVEQGNAVMEMRVITGRFSRPTPTLYSKVTTIVFNPSWTVPETILAKDVIPGMQNNPNYLKEHYDMRVYANWDKNAPEIDPLTIDWKNANAKNFVYRVSAPPGEKNPLGHVKFIFENEHDVYMHDTPDKALFSKIERAYSSGCIRLEKPFELVEYFYSDNTDLNTELVNQYLGLGDTKFVQLKNPMPIHITYITAWVDKNGYVHFREDIYQQSPGNSTEPAADIA